MKDYIKKASVLVPAFLIVSLGGAFFIGSIFWLLSVKYQLLEETSIFWLLIVPLGFPVFMLWFVLKPKLEILKFKPGQRGKFIFHLIAGLTLYAATLSIEQIVSVDNGKMTTLSSIYDLENNPITKYYSIEDYYIDTTYLAYYYDLNYSYGGSKSLDMTLYVAYPMYTNPEDLKKPNEIKYWFGITFDRSISTHLSEEEEKKEVDAKLSECFGSLNTYPFDETTFYMARLMQGKDNFYYKAINASFGQPSTDRIWVLYPRRGDFESRNDNLLGWFIFIQGIGLFLFMVLLLWPDFQTSGPDIAE